MTFKKTLISTFFLGISQLNAQEAIVTSGGNSNGSNGNLSYTVGQVAYTTNIGTNGSITQGVQQSLEIQTVLGIDNFSINLQLVVYPNPTSNWISLDVKNYSFEKLQYHLINLNGVLILNNKITSETTAIQMEQYSSAIYLLKVLENNKEIKTFKIIKK